MDRQRCEWCSDDEVYQHYHDTEWGVPCRDDRRLFEKVILEGAQAGLSWITILRRRENYRRAFDGFDASRIASYREKDILRLLGDAGIIRNRLKIESSIHNAQRYLAVVEETGSFSDFLWQFVEGEPIQNNRRTLDEIPVTTPESDRMSKELKKRGFKFVGSTICYAMMQSVGMVNDHQVGCFRHAEIKNLCRRSRKK